MIGDPPRSTLFPYEPLSRCEFGAALLLCGRLELAAGRHDVAPARAADRRRNACLEDDVAEPLHPRIVGCVVDRKSTRLNSSHANISYAVFCLKKKKKHTPPR